MNGDMPGAAPLWLRNLPYDLITTAVFSLLEAPNCVRTLSKAENQQVRTRLYPNSERKVEVRDNTHQIGNKDLIAILQRHMRVRNAV